MVQVSWTEVKGMSLESTGIAAVGGTSVDNSHV